LAEIDVEIAQVQEVKKLIASAGVASGNKSMTAARKRSKRKLSPEARARAAEARRKGGRP
jgi:hypothetical protein